MSAKQGKNKFISLTKVRVTNISEDKSMLTINIDKIVLIEPDGDRTKVFLDIVGATREVLVNENYEQVYQMITGRVFLK